MALLLLCTNACAKADLMNKLFRWVVNIRDLQPNMAIRLFSKHKLRKNSFNDDAVTQGADAKGPAHPNRFS